MGRPEAETDETRTRTSDSPGPNRCSNDLQLLDPTPNGGGRKPHALVMAALKRRLDQLTGVLPPSKPIVYVDYPVHDNIGDLLIHQGADHFLLEHGFTVLDQYSMYELGRLGPAGTVQLKPSIRHLDLWMKTGATLVMHGGGNLGDIWRHFQSLRELLIQRYPDNRVVILPQTIYFRDQSLRHRSGRIFSSHKDLFVFVRDRRSMDFVSEYCNGNGGMMPDMAHSLWGTYGHGRTPLTNLGRMLCQRRRDQERVVSEVPPASFDWLDLTSHLDRFAIRASRRWLSVGRFTTRPLIPNHRIWRWYRDNLIRRAVSTFAAHERIETDRLHGLILGSLLAKPVRYSDGNYGKLDQYAGVWLDSSDLVEKAISNPAPAGAHPQAYPASSPAAIVNAS